VSILVQPFASTNLWLSDQLFISEPPSPNIVIVGIDDDTLEDYGKWSEWSCDLHAQAINNLTYAEPKVIGFDILFVDTSSDDEVLASAVERAGNVVLPTVGTDSLPSTESMITYNRFLLPIASLEQVSNSIGHANITPDPGGVVRRLPLVVQNSSGQQYPALSVAILHTLFSMPAPEKYLQQDNSLHLLARSIPVDTAYRLRINFSGTNEERSYISYGDVISGDFDPSTVKNKIVLVGMAATGELDTWAIPTSASKVPGVLIHAAVMDTILKQGFLTEVGTETTLLTLLLLVGITAFALPRLRLRWSSALVGGLFASYLAASFAIFDRGYVLNMFYPLLILPLVYVSSILTQIVIEQSDKRFVKDLFGKYVSPQVAKEILSLADANQLNLGGEQKEITVLFADIRGFTKLSAQMSPEATVNMLNTYLSIMTDKVLQNGGMVNKFIGDNIMAVWNAPQPYPEHARLAVKTAWESQQAITELQQNTPSLIQVQFGIGINTGEALAGNVGSTGRSEYTVIGDAVNLAARICGVAPGSEVWIGPETYRQVKDYFETEELAPQKFKGKTEPVVVYRVTGLK